jgi:hypothetical protein
MVVPHEEMCTYEMDSKRQLEEKNDELDKPVGVVIQWSVGQAQGSLNVATAAKRARNATLFREAVSIAELVGADVLSEERVWRELTGASRNAGLRSFEIRITLASAFRRGLREPRLPR